MSVAPSSPFNYLSLSFNVFLSICLLLMYTAWIINGDYLNLIFLSFSLCSSCLSALPDHVGNLHHYHLFFLLFFFISYFIAYIALHYSWNDLWYCHWSCDKHLVFLSVCLSVPQSPQDTQPTSVLPDDSSSVLMDDTSSQWSAAADSEEERRSALEKSMYVFKQCKVHGIMILSHSAHVI